MTNDRPIIRDMLNTPARYVGPVQVDKAPPGGPPDLAWVEGWYNPLLNGVQPMVVSWTREGNTSPPAATAPAEQVLDPEDPPQGIRVGYRADEQPPDPDPVEEFVAEAGDQTFDPPVAGERTARSIGYFIMSLFSRFGI